MPFLALNSMGYTNRPGLMFWLACKQKYIACVESLCDFVLRTNKINLEVWDMDSYFWFFQFWSMN